MAALFSIGAGEKDNVVREVDGHDGGDVWKAKSVKRWSTTVEAR